MNLRDRLKTIILYITKVRSWKISNLLKVTQLLSDNYFLFFSLILGFCLAEETSSSNGGAFIELIPIMRIFNSMFWDVHKRVE